MVVTYADAFLSINNTQTIRALPGPAPPAGIRLVYDMPCLSFKVFKLTDPGLSINQACVDLDTLTAAPAAARGTPLSP